MTTQFYSHPASDGHDTTDRHPERIARLGAVHEALKGERFHALERVEPPRADLDTIALAHPRAFVDQLLDFVPSEGIQHIDPDTVVSAGSGDAALRAAGAAVAAVDAVMAGKARNAFCAMRPPGHHSEPSRAMGFCLFNNVAIGAYHARAAHNVDRAAVVDFDVHHGNGTQAIFWDDRDMFFGSTHQMPLYPGTGSMSETGVGNIFNAPLSPGDGGVVFRQAMERHILPALDAFQPDIVLISAGFDAHTDDPLASLNLVEDDFAWATRKIMDAADKHCGGRVVSMLEGGYNLAALGRSAAAHVAALMDA